MTMIMMMIMMMTMTMRISIHKAIFTEQVVTGTKTTRINLPHIIPLTIRF